VYTTKPGEALASPASPKRGWRRRIGIAVAVCTWLYLIAVLVLWGLLGAADLWWPATLLMFCPRWLLSVPPVLMIVAAGLLRRGRTLGAALLTLAMAAGPVAGFRIPWRSFTGSSSPGLHLRLRVLTCNMHYRDKDATALDQLLVEARPDVVALQEWPGWHHSRVLADSGWHVRQTPALFLASRFPIRRMIELGSDSMTELGSVARYDIEHPAEAVAFFNLHLASPRHGLYEVIHDRRQGIEELEAGSDLRREQSGNVADEVREVSGPVLLAGDFNTPSESDIFRRMWGQYTDAFSVAGWGWGYTFYGGRTAVRIDHILAGKGWRCERCRVGPDVGSPHRPVIADRVWGD
jgi:vancomycin resistance protein VanJ